MLGGDRELDYEGQGRPTFSPGSLSRLLRFVAERFDYDTK